jgi:DNA-binding NarL/FixJ family response regulator
MPPMAASPPVHALVDDLFFRAKIEATAAAAGVGVAFARDTAGIPADARLVLVDLSSTDAVAAIRALKERAPAPAVIAYGAHREVELLARAREAGADRVLARSALSERLPAILSGATG